MADEKSVTLYNAKGEAMQFSPKLYKAATAKGWSRTKPAGATPSSADAASSGAQDREADAIKRMNMQDPLVSAMNKPGSTLGASGSFGPPSAMSRLATGYGQGVNPLHQPPEGMPAPHGQLEAIGEDMLNLREIGQKGQQGDIAGGIGMMAGTITGLAGPEAIKAMVGGSRALKGAATIGTAARASERAADIQKEIKGSIKSARYAADLTQPIMEGLSKQFDRLHTLLDKEVLPHNPKITQTAAQMATASEPYIRKLGNDILQRTRTLAGGAQTLLEYGDAHDIHRQVMSAVKKMDAYKIGQWESTLRELDGYIEAGKEAVAKSRGVGDQWKSLTDMWAKTNDLAKATASRMAEGPSGMVGKMAEKVGLGGPKLPQGAAGAARGLASKAGVSGRELPKPGASMVKGGANIMQILGPLLRGGGSAMQGPQDAPIGTQ